MCVVYTLIAFNACIAQHLAFAAHRARVRAFQWHIQCAAIAMGPERTGSVGPSRLPSAVCTICACRQYNVRPYIKREISLDIVTNGMNGENNSSCTTHYTAHKRCSAVPLRLSPTLVVRMPTNNGAQRSSVAGNVSLLLGNSTSRCSHRIHTAMPSWGSGCFSLAHLFVIFVAV